MSEFRVIGHSVQRLEDPPLVRGLGRFLDDIHLPGGAAEAAFVRSPYAHAMVRGIDSTAALAMPGVFAVLTFADLAPHLTQERMPVQFRNSTLPLDCTPYPLAKTEVAYAGEPVAVVIAQSRYLAEDAAAMVEVDYEMLPAVSDCRRSMMPDSPPVRLDRKNKSNVLFEFKQSYGDLAAAFAKAPCRFDLTLKQHRGGPHSMEARGVLASYDAHDDKLTLWSSTQAAHELQSFVMDLLGLDEDQLHVVTPDVGGGFGGKFMIYPEEFVLAIASRLLNRAIKWVEDRREHFLATIQERDEYWDLEVACDNDGKLLGLRGRMIQEQGAYTPQGTNLAYNASTAVPGPYVLPAYELEVFVAETNKIACAPVRGAGYPEGCFAMERVIDRIATTLGLDRTVVRSRNLVPAEKMPYTSPLKSRSGSAIAYDTGNFPLMMKTAMDAIGYEDFLRRQKEARAQGRYLGIGIGNGMKGTGRGPYESALVRIGRSGRVSLYTGAMPMGQGLETALAQICAEQLGIEASDVSVTMGDTATIPLGMGGFASRQTVTAGSSTHLAAFAVREKALKMAAILLEAGVEDLELRDGRIEVRGVPGHGVTLRKVAGALAGDPGYSIPGDMEPGLESMQNFMPHGLTYGMSSHAAEVEVDIDTASVRVLRYVVVNDPGRAVNPKIVEGQIVGGTAHGIGNALYEWMGYDDDAQPITTNFAEYLIATAAEVPRVEVKLLGFPTQQNPLGVKGVGEAGCVPAAAAIVSAIEDALSPFSVLIDETPILPSRLFSLIREARKTD